ncbi:MAG: hypothetical protein KAT46_07670 [Deltaproteobacteria bacterium]|nr:hypothetical protein [Deltaproteobacteria bacterium]
MGLLNWYAENIQGLLTILSVAIGLGIITYAQIKTGPREPDLWEHEHLKRAPGPSYKKHYILAFGLIVFGLLSLLITSVLLERLAGN